MPRPVATGRPGNTVLGDAAAATQVVVNAAMPDQCTITRNTGTGRAYSPGTNTWANVAGTTMYPTGTQDGRCRILPEKPRDRTKTFGEKTVVPSRYWVAIPLGSYTPHLEDTVVGVVSSDPGLIGARLQVAEIVNSTVAAELLLLCDLIETR